MPRFFRGYTEIIAGSPQYSVDGPPPANQVVSQVVTAVDTRGRLLQSCTIRPAVRDPVLLPEAGVILLPGLAGRRRSGVVAYSTVTGARIWGTPAEFFVISADTVFVSIFTSHPGVAAYDAATGRRLWSDEFRGPPGAIAAIRGRVYAVGGGASPDQSGELIALRARDGRQLWQLTKLADAELEGLQIVEVDAATVLALPPTGIPASPVVTAHLIRVTDGHLLASVLLSDNGSYNPWRSWSALFGPHRAVVVSQGSNQAFSFTRATSYPDSVTSRVGESLAAVARSVAYFTSACRVPADPPLVTAVDMRTGQSLWTVRIAQASCTGTDPAPQVIAYKEGFAVRTSDGQLVLYR